MSVPISTPAGFAPGQAVFTGSPDGISAAPVTPTNPLPAVSPAQAYAANPITLSAGQATGTLALIAANAARKGLMFRAAADFELALTPSQSAGMRIYASARDSLVGAECPVGALYLVSGSGLNTGDVLTVWEA